MNGLTFVLPLLAIATACAYVCLRALREREQREARWVEHVARLAAETDRHLRERDGA